MEVLHGGWRVEVVFGQWFMFSGFSGWLLVSGLCFQGLVVGCWLVAVNGYFVRLGGDTSLVLGMYFESPSWGIFHVPKFLRILGEVFLVFFGFIGVTRLWPPEFLGYFLAE